MKFSNILMAAMILAVLATVIVSACVWLARQWKQRGSKLVAHANNVPGTGTRERGEKTFLAGPLTGWTAFIAAYPSWSNDQTTGSPTGRYALVIKGADENHVIPSSNANDVVIGICTDVPDAAEDPVNVQLLGATVGTLKCIAAGPIADGAQLQSNSDGAAKTATSGGYRFGRALQAAAGAGDVIEFQPYQPTAYAVSVG